MQQLKHYNIIVIQREMKHNYSSSHQKIHHTGCRTRIVPSFPCRVAIPVVLTFPVAPLPGVGSCQEFSLPALGLTLTPADLEIPNVTEVPFRAYGAGGNGHFSVGGTNGRGGGGGSAATGILRNFTQTSGNTTFIYTYTVNFALFARMATIVQIRTTKLHGVTTSVETQTVVVNPGQNGIAGGAGGVTVVTGTSGLILNLQIPSGQNGGTSMKAGCFGQNNSSGGDAGDGGGAGGNPCGASQGERNGQSPGGGGAGSGLITSVNVGVGALGALIVCAPPLQLSVRKILTLSKR